MVEFTLFEVHLDDSKLTANAPFSRGEKEVTAGDEPFESEEADDEEASSSKGTLLGAVVGLVFLVGVAYLARKKVGGDRDEQVELADVEA